MSAIDHEKGISHPPNMTACYVDSSKQNRNHGWQRKQKRPMAATQLYRPTLELSNSKVPHEGIIKLPTSEGFRPHTQASMLPEPRFAPLPLGIRMVALLFDP